MKLQTLAVEFAVEPCDVTEDYFIAADPEDNIVVEEICAVDSNIKNPESIIRFLTLLTVVPRATSRRRDSIMDFIKSVMLTSEEYVNATSEP